VGVLVHSVELGDTEALPAVALLVAPKVQGRMVVLAVLDLERTALLAASDVEVVAVALSPM